MKGHTRERGKGHWYAVIDVRDPVTDKRRRKWHSLPDCKGRRQAETACAQLIAEMERGTYLEPSNTTLSAYLTHWLAYKRNQISPRAHECYGEVIGNIVPAIGNAILSKLQPAIIARLYADTLERLSPRSVQMMHRLLSQAFKQAVKWQLLPRNPCDAVHPPRVERKQMRVLDAAGAIDLLEAARPRALFMPIMLSLLCGLRRGEVAALRWRDVNLNSGQLSIVHSLEQTKAGVRFKPKSGRSRTVALPAMAIEELRQHRIKQAQDLLRLGVRQPEDSHVCLQPNYQPWPPRNLSGAFVKFIVSSGLPRVRLHDLRHSHATHLLAANVHPKIVQERLGHANIATTMDLYTHVMPGMQDEAASRVDAALRVALGKHQNQKR
jgi:integrase